MRILTSLVLAIALLACSAETELAPTPARTAEPALADFTVLERVIVSGSVPVVRYIVSFRGERSTLDIPGRLIEISPECWVGIGSVLPATCR